MRRNSKRTWLLRGGGAVLLAATFGYGPIHLYSRSGLSQYLDLCDKLDKVRRDNARLTFENGRLEREAAALKLDSRSIEREARAQTNWVKPGEVVFDLGEQP
jgi:cell division protein FtsB